MTVESVALYEGIVYGFLLIIGGIVGYTKSQSRPSLFMGSGCGILALLLSTYGLRGGGMIALFLLAAEAILLSTFFYMRYTSSKKFMPAGLMMGVSVFSFTLYFVGICTT